MMKWSSLFNFSHFFDLGTDMKGLVPEAGCNMTQQEGFMHICRRRCSGDSHDTNKDQHQSSQYRSQDTRPQQKAQKATVAPPW